MHVLGSAAVAEHAQEVAEDHAAVAVVQLLDVLGRASAAARRGRARVRGMPPWRSAARQAGSRSPSSVVRGTGWVHVCERARASIATGDEGGLGWMCVNVFRRSSMRRLPAVLVVAALPLAAAGPAAAQQSAAVSDGQTMFFHSIAARRRCSRTPACRCRRSGPRRSAPAA